MAKISQSDKRLSQFALMNWSFEIRKKMGKGITKKVKYYYLLCIISTLNVEIREVTI